MFSDGQHTGFCFNIIAQFDFETLGSSAAFSVGSRRSGDFSGAFGPRVSEHFLTRERLCVVRVFSCQTTFPCQTTCRIVVTNEAQGTAGRRPLGVALMTTQMAVAETRSNVIVDRTKTFATCCTEKTTTNS